MKHKQFFFSIFLFLAAPALANAQVSGIAITTSPQSIEPSAVSGQITVQAQDAAGSPLSGGVPQTGCLLFSTTLSGGQFSSSATTWSPVSVLTMNKSTVNRSFFYKSSTEGVQTLSVKLVLKPEDESRSCANWPTEEWGSGWTASQAITVGAAPSVTEQNQTQSQPQAQTQTQVAAPAGTAVVPALSARIKASARVSAAAGSAFEGEVFGAKGEPLGAGARYIWNFGDGVVAEGQRVFHAYAYPGSYIVSLSVGYNYSSGSARMVVEATQAQVALLAEGDGSLLVTNQSDQELNIGLWSLREGGLFVVPEDTLVLPQSGVRFSPQVLGFSGDVGAALYYPNGTLAASAKSSLSSSMRGEPVSTQDMKKYVAQAPLFEAPEGVDIYAPALPASEEGEVLGASDEYFSTEEEKSSSTFWFSLAGLAGVLAAGAVAVHYVRLQQLRRLETSPAAEEFTLE